MRLRDAGMAKHGWPSDPCPRPRVMINSLKTGHQSARHNLSAAAIPWCAVDQLNSRHHANTQPSAAATSGPVAETSETVVICCGPAAGDVLRSGCVQARPANGASAAVPAWTPYGALQLNDGLRASAPVLPTASSSGCVASSGSEAGYLLHTTDLCSYLCLPVSVGSTRPAAAGPAEATPEASYGPAAPNNGAQQVHAISSSTSSSDGAGAGASSSSGSDSDGSCSSNVNITNVGGLSGPPGEAEGSGSSSGGPSGPAGPASDGANHEDRSRRPLVEEAKAYLLKHFPESADDWKLLRAEDLQRAKHQQAYIALQQHIFGMRIRVEFGKKFNTRSPNRGIAFLDPRPASHIMHNNHDKTPVRAPDGSMSMPDTISVQEYLLNKHDVVLQHPEWPCVGYMLPKQEACQGPPQETDFITYPMEFCSVLLGARSEPKRSWPCEPWGQVWLEALPGSAQVPSWVAETLNESCSQQEQASSLAPAAAVGSTAGSSSTAVGPSSSTDAAFSSSGRPTSIENGYRKLVSQLPPSKDEARNMRRVLSAVCQAICSIKESNKMEWHVTEVLKAGSFAKKTSLGGSSDLDVVVKIKCHAPFHHCPKKLLSAILQNLCRRSDDRSEDETEYGDCAARMSCTLLHYYITTLLHYYIKLEHPILGLQLDVQVAEHFGIKSVQKEMLLDQLLEAAAVLEAGPKAACPSSSSSQHQAQSAGGHSSISSKADGAAPPAVAASLKGRQVSRTDVYSDRQRVTNLADLMTDVVTGVEKRCDQRGLPGMGSLITNTIRMMKAWSRFGLPKALAAAAAARRASSRSTAAASSTSATPDAAMMPAAAAVAPAAADAPKGPPGYIWEIFVVYVLEHRMDQGKTYHPGQPSELFLDVLLEASQLLRSSMQKSEAIIVPLYYRREQALMSIFQDERGEDGCPYAPYIISPLDPSYNCNENAAFRDYDALADAAGRLYEQLKVARTVPSDREWLCQNTTLGPVAEEFAVDT